MNRKKIAILLTFCIGLMVTLTSFAPRHGLYVHPEGRGVHAPHPIERAAHLASMSEGGVEIVDHVGSNPPKKEVRYPPCSILISSYPYLILIIEDRKSVV